MSLNESYRPRYHFTVPRKWMNDPNGLVYYAGEYHLFYQYNPADTVWGPMHWGHAISADLVNWQHLPIALYPDENGTIYSGSAVIDWADTAGFGAEAMVAVFTHDQQGRQSQSLGYSLDRGRTWAKYAGNPVLEPPHDVPNFRDPKVFWYQAGGGPGHWVMAIASGTAILFFTSSDLKAWAPSGGLGFGYGAGDGVWETPDLFSLSIDGGPKRHWVLTAGVGSGGPAGGGSGTQYFVGDFDGQSFTSDNPKDTVLWADLGADFYAAQSWSGAPDGRRLWLGWMNNWLYANVIPTESWRGAMSLPRELALVTTPAGLRLAQQPVRALESLRAERRTWQGQTTAGGTNLLAGLAGAAFEVLADFEISPGMPAHRLGLRLSTAAESTATVGYSTRSHTLFLERGTCGATPFSPVFGGVQTAALEPREGVISLHIFIDASSIEVFGNDGETVMTNQIFLCPGTYALELFADGGRVPLKSLAIFELRPAEFVLAAADL